MCKALISENWCIRDQAMNGLLEMLSHPSVDWCISKTCSKDMAHLSTEKENMSISCLFVVKFSINGGKIMTA